MPEPLTWGNVALSWGMPGLVWGATSVPNTPPLNPMATSNRISIDITTTIRDQFIAKVNEAFALLPAGIPTLTPEERQTIPSIGDKLQPFDNAVATVVPQFPLLVPPYQNAAEAAKDRATRTNLHPMLLAATALCEKLSDTDKLLGADLFDFDHAVLYTARDAAKRGSIPGADTALATLEDAYPKKKPKAPTPPANPNP